MTPLTTVRGNEQVVDPTVTGTVNDPSAVGVPLAFKTMACAPAPEKVPDALNVTPLTAVVTMEYVPTVVTSTFTVAVFEELVATPAAYVPCVDPGLQLFSDPCHAYTAVPPLLPGSVVTENVHKLLS